MSVGSDPEGPSGEDLLRLGTGIVAAYVSRNAVSGRLDRTLMACAHCSQRCALRAVNIRNATAGKIPLDRA